MQPPPARPAGPGQQRTSLRGNPMTPQVNRSPRTEKTADVLSELVAHLRRNRTQLREEWVRRITESRLLIAMSKEEIFAEATSVFDHYVEVLETGSVEALQAYARNLSERIIPRGVDTPEVVGIVLLLRDVLARSLFEKYRHDPELLNRVLDAYEPAANRIATTVAVSFVEGRGGVRGGGGSGPPATSRTPGGSSRPGCPRFGSGC